MLSRAGLAFLFCALASGCAVIDQHEKVAGWPELRLVEHYVADAAMRQRCAKYVPFGLFPEACAEFYFDRGECHVWYSKDFPPQPYVKEHERLHCEGYAHLGDGSMRDILARYNATRSAAAGGTAAPGGPLVSFPRKREPSVSGSGKAAPG